MNLDFALVHTVDVETFTGGGTYGDHWNASVPVNCWVEDVVHQVLDKNGTEVTSTGTVTANLEQRTVFTDGSKVTLPSGRVARVITLSVLDSGPLGIGLDHVKAHLT